MAFLCWNFTLKIRLACVVEVVGDTQEVSSKKKKKAINSSFQVKELVCH